MKLRVMLGKLSGKLHLLSLNQNLITFIIFGNVTCCKAIQRKGS